MKQVLPDDLVAAVRPDQFQPGAVHRQEGAIGRDQRHPHGNGFHDQAQSIPLLLERLFFVRHPADLDGPFRGHEGRVEDGSESRAIGDEEIDPPAELLLGGLAVRFRGEDHYESGVLFVFQPLGHGGDFRGRDGAVDQQRIESAGVADAHLRIRDSRGRVDLHGGGEGLEFAPERGLFTRIAADIE